MEANRSKFGTKRHSREMKRRAVEKREENNWTWKETQTWVKKTFNQDYKLHNVYLNGREPHRDGSFHTDNDADRTVVLYFNSWKPSWGGFTQFMRSEIDHTIVPPILGRLVNFRSDILHKAYAYCNSNCPIRITAAFKLKL